MNPVYAIAHACFCPLGNSSEEVFNAVVDKRHAINIYENNEGRRFGGSFLNAEQKSVLNKRYPSEDLTVFEKMCVYVIEDTLKKTNVDITRKDCLIILSTTKGNIELLDGKQHEKMGLRLSGQAIAAHFGNPNSAKVISNACISGSLALITGKRYLENGIYKHVVVVGCDRLSDFVLAGFQSFQALSQSACRPFSQDRDGLNLGEAAACIILSLDSHAGDAVAVLSGGAVSNDANHLSGPSRTGAELADAILKSISEAGIAPNEISMISGHGTATNFNDEMESKAFTIAGVNYAPLHSLKSFVGHTLGAAGIIESIIACMGMQEGILIPSLNFKGSGVSCEINVTTSAVPAVLDNILKTASGFGGCNAALIWKRGKS